ncbi:MAG TPA: MASE1 domain-containing protein [Gemmatimonadales bacterium]|nr:MASE1 domain-containing protein [Gemmatimonadales bacterium]
MARLPLAYPARLIAIAVAYVLTARLGQAVAIDPGNVTTVWFPSGIAVGALILWGAAVWPAVWVGAFAYNLWFFLHGGVIDPPIAMLLAIGIATGSTLMALVGSTLVGLVQGYGEDLGRPRDALAYLVLAGMLATTLSATVGTAVLLLGGLLPVAQVAKLWITWWLGDATGVILVAPMIVLFGRLGPPRFPGARAWPAVVGALLLSALLFFSFGPTAPRGAATLALALPITFLSWTAFVLGRRITVLAAFVISCVAVLATVHGEGPLVGRELNSSLLLLHSFLDTAALTALLLATTVRATRTPAAVLPGATPAATPTIPAEQQRQMDQALAQRRREESALADRVRSLAEEARALERQLERRVAERDAILAVLPDLFYVIDRTTQRFLMTSEAFAREAAGVGRDEVVGRNIYDVLAPELALRLGEQHREVFSTGDLLHLRETLPLPAGPRELDTLKAPFRGPDGEITGLVSSSRATAPRP